MDSEAFTSITIPLEDIEEKSIILHYAGGNMENKFLITRLLLSITAWSTVETLEDKLVVTLRNKGRDIHKDGLSAYLVKDGVLPLKLNRNIKVFHLMCEDGAIWIYDTTVGELSLNLQSFMSESSNTISSNNDADKVASTSTPTSSDVSDIGTTNTDMGKLQNIPIQKRGYSALVFVKFMFPSSISSYTLVLRFPRISHGLHVYERVLRIFDLHHSNCQTMSVSVKNKNGHCLFCLNPCCSGCPVQLNDKVMLSQHYTLDIMFNDFSTEKLFQVKDDISLTSNAALHMLTLNECLTGFMEKKETSLCPSCLNSSWKNTNTVIVKYPAVLIIHLPMSLKKEFCINYPVEKISSHAFKRDSKGLYSLQGVITNDGDESAFVKGIDENDWLVKSGNCIEKVSTLPSNHVELLFYVKNKGGTISHAKITKRIQKRRMVVKTRFSARTGAVTSQFGRRSHQSSFDTTSGHYDSRSSVTSPFDQQSTCDCDRCHTLEKIQTQMSQSRPTSQCTSTNADDTYRSVKSCQKLDRSSDRSSCSGLSETSFLHERRLHKAIRKQNLKGVVKSINDGADVNHILKGSAALHLTVAMVPPFGSVFTKLCLEHGADANLPSAEGLTPVHIAVKWGRVETLRLLLQHGGVPSVKNAHGKSSFDLLIQAPNNKSEVMLRMLRGENDEAEAYRLNHIQTDAMADDMSLLHVSGTECHSNQIIGETTFDEVFKHAQLPTLEEEDVQQDNNVSDLKESVVSQHFTDIDNSNPSFNGSQRNTWRSFFTCSGRFSRVRRRRNEERWITRVTRNRITNWFNNLFRRQ